MTDNRESPNQKRVYKFGGIAVLISILLSCAAIFLIGISIAESFNFVCAAVVLFSLQLLVLLFAAIYLTQDILIRG